MSSGPGSVGCRTSYGSKENALDVAHRPEAAAARQEVKDLLDPDRLGLKQKQWNISTVVTTTKNNRKNSDLQLTNTLNTEQLTATGTWLRATSGFQHDPVKMHAFDRGEVTTGWNFSTAVDPKEKGAQLNALDTTAKATTRQLAGTLREYRSPIQRETEFMETKRHMLATAGHSDKALDAQWGKEAADELRYISTLPQPKTRPRIKATQADLAAVLALPGGGAEDD